MRHIALAAFASLAVSPALGDETMPPGAVTVAPDGAVAISSAPCKALTAGPDFVAGIDVEGNAVAPADLSRDTPPAAGAPAPPTVALDARLARRFGASVPGGGGAILGFVTARDGHAYFNGQPLAADASAALSAACRATKTEPPSPKG